MIHGHELFSLCLGNWHFLARRPFLSFWRTPAPCVLGLEHSCPRPREVNPWPWSRMFLYHWRRLRTLCPRLYLCPRQIINYTASEKNATWGVKNVSVKLNITIIVWMAGKMRAAVNEFFTRRHWDEEKLPWKIWALFEKNNDLLFLRFYNCELFRGGGWPRTNCKSLQGLPPWYSPAKILMLFLLNFTKWRLAAETRALTHR